MELRDATRNFGLIKMEKSGELIMKRIFIAVLIFIVIVFSGCSLNSNESTSKGEEQSNGVTTDSPGNNDWKVLSNKDTLYKMIYGGEGRGSTPLEGDKTVEYSLRVPASWSLDGTVLSDSKNNKIAEIAPVVLLNPGEEAKFLDYKTKEGNLISKESISVAEYKGTKVILQTDMETGSWYPHIYLLSDGELGFTFIIYSKNQNRNKAEEKLFDGIAQTIKF
jgi:hypothetical protein